MTIEFVKSRTGNIKIFDSERINSAIEKAFVSANITDISPVSDLTKQVVTELTSQTKQNVIEVEKIQDTVEVILMQSDYVQVAKNFILYRSEHTKARQEKVQTQIKEQTLQIKVSDSESVIFNPSVIEDTLRSLSTDLKKVSITDLVENVKKNIYNNITQNEINQLILSCTKERIETHYDYAKLAARISINNLYKSILNTQSDSGNLSDAYQTQFKSYVEQGIKEELLNPELANFDFGIISKAIKPERDSLFYYLGIQILIDRYFIRERSYEQHVIELPQWFWMRVSMGLALKEENKEEAAIQFYNVLSKMDLVSSTPTLFNSGTCHSQMSSCYLNTSDDSLANIFKLYTDNAFLSKWAGGIGSDFTNIRATGSKIKGTNGLSQGVIPFIKIFNDTALAVNQGGKRKGAACAYMEIWHRDFEQFLELKKNTGDERRRAHDVNTAAWIPDLFMKRVQENKPWTLFCPSETPDLHDLYGKEFEERYEFYETQNLSRSKSMPATDIWRKLLTMLYETGHPWLTFKDPCNVRSPQDHVGVVHSSNLCTEITLNTSKDETAVCNLASLNLSHMIEDGALNKEKMKTTISIGIRMLDNVIDNNFYPIPEASKANFRHRAIGLGLMGYQDALYKLNIPFSSDKNVEFADESMETISYYAILASSQLAKERGSYETFKGSKWDRGILPIDSLSVLEEERGQAIDVPKSTTMDWAPVREHIKKYGMRNSNIMAIAPTATIANISGIYPCTEPAFRNLYMKENLSGSFTVINRYLIDDLDKIGLWTPDILTKIKLKNGSILDIDDIPSNIKDLYKETFEIDMKWIIDTAARRSKWIDQSASTNIFVKTQSGKVLSNIYMMAWQKGLKTTYYLRSLGATQVNKASTKETTGASTPQPEQQTIQADAVACSILDPSCEACQ